MFFGKSIVIIYAMAIENIIGMIGCVLTPVSFVPQVVKAIKTKSMGDISLGMYSILTTGIVAWLIYGIILNLFPVILANTVALILTLTILILKLIYK
ncbi:MAG: SemiSWEET transporter [Planctomycetota bacterium]